MQFTWVSSVADETEATSQNKTNKKKVVSAFKQECIYRANEVKGPCTFNFSTWLVNEIPQVQKYKIYQSSGTRPSLKIRTFQLLWHKNHWNIHFVDGFQLHKSSYEGAFSFLDFSLRIWSLEINVSGTRRISVSSICGRQTRAWA